MVPRIRSFECPLLPQILNIYLYLIAGSFRVSLVDDLLEGSIIFEDMVDIL